MRAGTVGELLADAGAVVGGGAALGATLGFIIGSLGQEFGGHADPEWWTRRGGQLGGIFGMLVFLEGA